MIYREIFKIAVFFVYDLLNIGILRRINFNAALINQVVCLRFCIPFRDKRLAHISNYRVDEITVNGGFLHFFFVIVVDVEIFLDGLDVFFIRNEARESILSRIVICRL